MRTIYAVENKYWKDHPVFQQANLIASKKHESGDWECFEVVYKEGNINYHGGAFTEYYWNGDFQESFPASRVTNPDEQLDQFIEFWLDENRG